MLNEVKKIFENIVHFRQLLKEGASESAIVDAIKQHKIVYIYYAGDDTIMKGYRTIKPMVLGYSISKKAQAEGGYQLLRAWEVAGNSDSKKRYPDNKGRMQYGWRLFRVDKITSFLPTGKFFSTEESKFPDVENYNPNDSQMTNIVAAVEIVSDNPRTTQRGAVIGQKIKQPTSTFDGQKEKFQYFSKAGNRQRQATAEEIKHLWDIANTIKKKSREKLLVVADENGDLVLKDVGMKDKLPPESIIGNLKDLYIRLVQPNQHIDNSFIKTQSQDLKKKVGQENNVTQENIDIKTFFK